MAKIDDVTGKVSVLEERVQNHIRFFWTAVAFGAFWLGALTYQVQQISGELKTVIGQLQGLSAPQKVSAAALNPIDPANQQKVVLALAQSGEYPIPKDVVTDAAKRFVSAAARDGSAWPTALRLVEYTSKLNNSLMTTTLQSQQDFNVTYHIDRLVVKNRPTPSVSHSGMAAAIDNEAIIQSIDQPPTNNTPKTGPSFLRMRDGAISLDNSLMKHVYLVGVEVHYSGKPAILTDVAFINCTFVMDNVLETRRLADTILASAKIDFSTNG